MKSTNKTNYNQDVLGSKKVVLLDVWAPWCGPCRSMEPVLEAVVEETKTWAEIVKLDVSVEMDLAQELGVSGLPTFMVFKNGKMVTMSSGITSKANILKMMSQAV